MTAETVFETSIRRMISESTDIFVEIANTRSYFESNRESPDYDIIAENIHVDLMRIEWLIRNFRTSVSDFNGMLTELERLLDDVVRTFEDFRDEFLEFYENHLLRMEQLHIDMLDAENEWIMLDLNPLGRTPNKVGA